MLVHFESSAVVSQDICLFRKLFCDNLWWTRVGVVNTTWWAWGIKKNREDEVYRFHKKSRYREVVIQQNISCCEIIYIRRGCEHFANSCSAIGTLVVIVIGYATVKSIRIGNISVILNGKVCNGWDNTVIVVFRRQQESASSLWHSRSQNVLSSFPSRELAL